MNTKKKSGWAAIEEEDKKEAEAAKRQKPFGAEHGEHKKPVAQSKAAPKKAKPTKAAKPKKVKEVKPPFGVLVGRTNGEKYVFTRESFNDQEALGRFVASVLTREKYDDGLREIMIHLREVKAPKEAK